jgi:hypothetical protein
MNWIGMLVGAASGALAVLLFAGIMRLSGSDPAKPKTWQKWGYYLLFAFVFGVSKEAITPRIALWYQLENLESELVATNPAFTALQKFEPQTFALIVADAKATIQAGGSVKEADAKMRSHFAPLMEKRLPIAEDILVHRYMKVNIQELRELMTGGDDACYTLMFPASGPPIDVFRRLNPDTLKADLAAAAMVIESAATRAQKPVELEGELLEAAAPVFGKVQSKHGHEWDLIDTPQSTLKGKRYVCQIVHDLYDGILALPPETGGRVVRAMLNQVVKTAVFRSFLERVALSTFD